MSRTPAVCLILLLGACRGPEEYSAPAPAGALDCALREAREMGYSRMTGEPEEDYVRVSQRTDLPLEIRPEGRDPLPGPEAVRPAHNEEPMFNELMLREDGGRLRIQIVGRLEGGEVIEAGRDAESHAQRILAACSTG
jgi:hypothetical protein